MVKDQEFDRTASAISFLAKCMSDIHEAYPDPKDKKLKEENRKFREKLLEPYRKACIEIHYARINFNRERYTNE